VSDSTKATFTLVLWRRLTCPPTRTDTLSSLTTGEFFLKVEKKRTKEVDEGGKIHIGNCVLSGESCAVNILMFFKLNKAFQDIIL